MGRLILVINPGSTSTKISVFEENNEVFTKTLRHTNEELAPFSDVIGLSRQATVMAYQFGDGFTNMITPTSAVLMGALGIARIPYEIWVKWFWKLLLLFIILGLVLLIPTVLFPLNGF